MKKQTFVKDSHISRYLMMINDGWRNKFFKDALEKHAKDKIVLDMGSGTGILSFYALAAGAKFVYCVDMSPKSCLITEKVLSKHFDSRRFKVLNCNFWTDEIDNQIDQKIDILVTETIGPGLFDQGMFHTWHTVKPFLSDQAISIPDRLHFDAWIWDNVDICSNSDLIKPVGDPLYCDEVLNDDFARCLAQVDRELTMPFDDMNWVIGNNINPPPSKIYQDVLTYTMDKLPNLSFSDQKFPRHIIPEISFEIDIDKPGTIGIIHKMSFENETLFLKDARYMPWKYIPMFFINSTGKYTFTYNNPDLQCLFYNEWLQELKTS